MRSRRQRGGELQFRFPSRVVFEHDIATDQFEIVKGGLKGGSDEGKETVEIQMPDTLVCKPPSKEEMFKVREYLTQLLKEGNRLKVHYEALTPPQDLALLVLMLKYDVFCSFGRIGQTNRPRFLVGIVLSIEDGNLVPADPDTYAEFVEKFKNCYERNLSSIVIWLSIRYHGSQDNHRCLLFYRRANNTMELFDNLGRNNGTVIAGVKAYIDALNEAGFIQGIGKVKLVVTHEECPLRAVPPTTRKERPGTCQLYSLFFAELCLKNPSLSGKELYQLMGKFNEQVALMLLNKKVGWSDLSAREQNNRKNVMASQISEAIIDAYGDFVNKTNYKYFWWLIQPAFDNIAKRENQDDLQHLQKVALEMYDSGDHSVLLAFTKSVYRFIDFTVDPIDVDVTEGQEDEQEDDYNPYYLYDLLQIDDPTEEELHETQLAVWGKLNEIKANLRDEVCNIDIDIS